MRHRNNKNVEIPSELSCKIREYEAKGRLLQRWLWGVIALEVVLTIAYYVSYSHYKSSNLIINIYGIVLFLMCIVLALVMYLYLSNESSKQVYDHLKYQCMFGDISDDGGCSDQELEELERLIEEDERSAGRNGLISSFFGIRR
ncbi:MAG: hypothetical protein ACI376_03570 [Candidatus Bruticola sp.]